MTGSIWKAGAAFRTLTVPAGTIMDGYGSRQNGVEGELAPLEVNVLYLSAGGGGALLVSLDLLAVDRPWVTCLRRSLQRQLGICAENVFVAASHTHAGPAGFRRTGSQHRIPASARRSLRRSVLALTLEAAGEAIAASTSAVVTIGSHLVEGVAANRRDPAGPADLTLTAIAVRATTGKSIAALWHFACHPTILNAENHCLSPDLPGALRRRLRERIGYDCPVLYFNGAAADVSTRFTRRGAGTAELDRLGALLAESYPRAGELLAASGVTGSLQTVRLPAAPAPDPADVARRLADAETALATARASGRPPAEVRLKEVEAMGARKRLNRVARPAPAAYRTAVQVLRLGELALVSFPGELYALEGLTLTGASPVRTTLPVGYAGDYMGYLTPSGDLGGYESDSALVAPGAGERLVLLALSMLKEAQYPCSSESP
jgi:neutral ceramidase